MPEMHSVQSPLFLPIDEGVRAERPDRPGRLRSESWDCCAGVPREFFQHFLSVTQSR